MSYNNHMSDLKFIVAGRTTEEDMARLRRLTVEQRGAMLEACCRSAAQILASRAASGFPPPVPAPWPDSTWELLRRFAPNARPHRVES
jgi:hypothetical protein